MSTTLADATTSGTSPASATPVPPVRTPWYRSRRTWGRILLVVAGSYLWVLGLESIFVLTLRLQGPQGLLLGPTLVGTACLWIWVLALHGLTGRLRRAWLISLGVVVALAGINAARMEILHAPLVPGDWVYLRTPGFLTQMVSPLHLAVGILGLALLLALGWLLARRLGRSRRPLRRGDSGWAVATGLRVTSVAAGLALAVVASGFTELDNPLRRAYDASGAWWTPWSQNQAYARNGFLGGALYNLPTDPMEVPPGYGPDRMAQIAAKWSTPADPSDSAAPTLAETNVVVVLSESMGDPQELRSVGFEQDVIPHIRQQMARTGGHTLSFYGTGTSAMEFAVLTGQTLSLFGPQITSPYQQFLPDQDDYPSLVGWMKQTGHRTVAVHPYTSEMYRRTDAYETLGFDEFRTRDSMAHTGKDGGAFISDASAFAEVIDVIEQNERPVLTHLVTMQNHMPYDEGSFGQAPVAVTGSPGRYRDQLGVWARGLAVSDTEVPQFLDAVRRTGEPTVVIYFGDHFPGLFDSSTTEAEGQRIFRTPYFVWSSENPDGQAPGGGVVSPTSFMGQALDLAGVPLPPYLRLLAEVQDKVGTLRGDHVIASDGTETAMADLSVEQRDLVAELRLVQYDFSVGQRYGQDALWYPRPD